MPQKWEIEKPALKRNVAFKVTLSPEIAERWYLAFQNYRVHKFQAFKKRVKFCNMTPCGQNDSNGVRKLIFRLK